jgi:hypothetical protein
MNRRTTLMLTGMTLLGLALAASPQVVWAQSDPFDGIWQLNPAKSKLAGPYVELRAALLYVHGEGQNRKLTAISIRATGEARSLAYMPIYDGQPHPTTGSPDYDASAYTRVDPHTIDYSRTEAGKVVQTGTMVVSQDGKTATLTAQGIDANGRGWNSVNVYDKQ